MNQEAMTNTAPAEPRDAHRGGDSYEASMLRNLLARIHRDGGHYVEEHGLDKAVDDAEVQVVYFLSLHDRLMRAEAALTELVRCKELKEKAEALAYGGFKGLARSDGSFEWEPKKTEHDATLAEYERRKSPAWAAAREITGPVF